MSEAKRILSKKGDEAVKAGRLFLDAVCGDSRGKKVVVDTARERGRHVLASVVDAEFGSRGAAAPPSPRRLRRPGPSP